MGGLTTESTAKLQKIFRKRVGRELSQEELEQAYDALMGFAVTLVELSNNDEPEVKPPPQKTAFAPKIPLAIYKPNVIHCY